MGRESRAVLLYLQTKSPTTTNVCWYSRAARWKEYHGGRSTVPTVLSEITAREMASEAPLRPVALG